MGGTNCANDLGSNSEPLANGDDWSSPTADSKGRRRENWDKYCSGFVSGKT